MSDPDADMVMTVLSASPNRDEPGALLRAAKAYAALKSSRERDQRDRATNTERSTNRMTAVKLKGTWSKNERDSNGLEAISSDLVKNEFSRYLVVGMVEQHKVTKEPGEAPIPTARFVAIEVGQGDDEELLKQILDRARKARGLGQVPDDLFSVSREDFNYDGPAPAMPGQEPIDGIDSEPETRLGPDGPHEVAPPSAEEELAEREEAKAAGVPAAEFKAGAE